MPKDKDNAIRFIKDLMNCYNIDSNKIQKIEDFICSQDEMISELEIMANKLEDELYDSRNDLFWLRQEKRKFLLINDESLI